RKQNSLLISDLDAGIKKVEAQVENGTAYRSNLALLLSEKLRTKQRDIELLNDREGSIGVLELLTGKQIGPLAVLKIPQTPTIAQPAALNRPELRFFQFKDSLAHMQDKLIDGRLKPRVNLFANTGYGRPALDMLKNEFSPFIIAGIRFNWNISAFYNSNKERTLNDITRRDLKAQEDHFRLNVQTQLRQQESVLKKIQELLETDNEIVQLKLQVKDAANAQLENGVITASDYLREVHAADNAQRTQMLHQLQLLQAALTYSIILGN
ncbi:MAG TPA: TolC family protein, partial [Phnomibacter sp.]|nr:TolC family protein [Phnomibacter sp.]